MLRLLFPSKNRHKGELLMHRSLLILLFSALLITSGCGGGPSEADMEKRVRAPSLSEDQALDKAKQAVRQNDSFADSADYAIKATGDSGWTITVTGSGGEFRLIVLDEQGEILRYEGS